MKRFAEIFFFLAIFIINMTAQKPNEIIVAADGSGNYKTITEAVQNLPMFNYGRVIIFIKNGVYNEKIRIEKDNITFRGESREKTIWQYNQLRSDWDKNRDNIGPGVLNIYADDIIVENITIENTQPEVGPHAFVIYGFGTRTILQNCNLISKGADTVSLWDYKSGMYYHANCYFEGAVDFVCPRGWCFIKDSKFYERKATASVWHAGGFDINQKFVIINSSFDGVKGFELGRHHYEAQFIFVDCSFSENMSDKGIYRVTYPNEPQKDRSFNWGKRYYFSNCHRSGGDADWLKNNFKSCGKLPVPENITPSWTFDGKWDPESKEGPKILNYKIDDDSLYLFFSERIAVIGNPVLKSQTDIIFKFHSGGENNTIRFIADKKFSAVDLEGLKIMNEATVIGTVASVETRNADFQIGR